MTRHDRAMARVFIGLSIMLFVAAYTARVHLERTFCAAHTAIIVDLTETERM